MSVSIPTVELSGDVAVGRNVCAGGKATVRGSVVIDHNLSVKGWVDAPNVKCALKGLFASEDALRDAYPSPEPGWVAYVGDNLPAAVYVVSDGVWVATGSMGGEPSLSADGIYEIVEGVRQDVLGLEAVAGETQKGLAQARKEIDGLRGDVSVVRDEVANLGGRVEEAEEVLRSNIGRKVDVTELDSRFTADSASVLKVADGSLAGCWNVTVHNGGNVRTIGVLRVWVDDALHTVTQVFTTNALLNGSQIFECVHDHGVHTYSRFFTVKYDETLADGSVLPARSWSRWCDVGSGLEAMRGEMTARMDGFEARLLDLEVNVGAGGSYDSLLSRVVRLERGLDALTRLLTIS